MFRRFHSFEFCDQSWVKGVAREAFMDCLEAIYRAFGPYEKSFPILDSEARTKGPIIDLATGNAAPIITFLKFLEKKKKTSGADSAIPNLSVIATDLYPHLEAWENIKRKYPFFSFREQPFDAIRQKEDIPCVYTMFSAFHHFNEDQALELIVSKVSDTSDLMIFEMTPRDDWANYIWLPFSMPFFMLSSLFARQLKFSKIFISLIIPIVPVMVIFDGLMSNLRTYTRSELEALADQASQASGKNIKAEYIVKRYSVIMHSYSCRFFIQ